MGTAAQRMGTARLGTAAGGPDMSRPMTSIRGAGYTSSGKPPGTSGMSSFAGQQAGTGPAPPLEKIVSNTPEDKARDKEAEVNALLEESAKANVENRNPLALEKAKECAKKERQLCKFREQANLQDSINVDLTYAVCFNLANQFQANEMFMEALNTYSLIVKNKQYSQSGRLRVNMGNIYFRQKKFPSAIKMYRMALDQIPTTGKELRFKIMANIGHAFVKMGNYQDAIMSYEAIMEGRPDIMAGFNLVVCYFATGDKEKMKRGFAKLLSIPDAMSSDAKLEEEDAADDADDDDGVKEEDELAMVRKAERTKVKSCVLQAAKLIAPKIEEKFVDGFDYVIEALRSSQDYTDIASDMEISKAVYFLKKKDPKKAKETLEAIQKKDKKLHDATTLSRAATNLCFIHSLEGDYRQADEYGTAAIRADRYNAKALVNKANCEIYKARAAEERDRLEEARELYQEAKNLYMEGIGVEADCVEAIFNLGLCCRRMAELERVIGQNQNYVHCVLAALQAFEKLRSIMPDSADCIWNIATICDELDAFYASGPEGVASTNVSYLKKASTSYKALVALVKTDAAVLARYGALLARDDDESQAFTYHSISYKHYPVDMEVISWLGAYFVKSEMYEKAIDYFQKAAQIQPKEVKWQLMVASCYRRVQRLTEAFATYKLIDKKHPDNVECLNYLVKLSKELGHPEETKEYQLKLSRAEKEQDARSHQRPPAAQQATRQDLDAPRGGAPQQARQSYDNGYGGGGGYGGYGEFQSAEQAPARGGRASGDAEAEAARAVAERANVGGGKVIQKGRKADDDDWGNDELGDDLLPM